MSTLTTYGELNGPMLGILMKELARRAIRAIEVRRMGFTEYSKASYNPNRPEDVFTDADQEAQQIYLRSLRECTPAFGIIGEEANLRIECTHPTLDIYWTIDPLDGTRAFIRKQSHGIGTMLSLVCNGEVIAAIVGDVMTRELFYFRPGSNAVYRIYDFSSPEPLSLDPNNALKDQYVLLRDPPEKYSSTSQRLVKSTGKPGPFKSYQIADGSIGTMMARLWKGEVAAAVLRPSTETPWDMCPIVGISQKLGFVFLQATAAGWSDPISIKPLKNLNEREGDLLILPRSRLFEFQEWIRQ